MTLAKSMIEYIKNGHKKTALMRGFFIT